MIEYWVKTTKLKPELQNSISWRRRHSSSWFSICASTTFRPDLNSKKNMLEEKLEALLCSVESHRNAIWIFHAPRWILVLTTHVTGLTEKKLEWNEGAGCQKAIEKYQPSLFLCGHIHESRGSTYIDNSLCINPGAAKARDAKAVFIYLNDLKKAKLVPFNWRCSTSSEQEHQQSSEKHMKQNRYEYRHC